MENNKEREKSDYSLKIILIGDGGSGKTSLVNQFVHRKFSNIYKTTIGVDITPYKTTVKETGEYVRFVLWDMSGQTHFEKFRARFYAGSSGAIIVYDLTNAMSYRNVTQWIKECHDSCNKAIPITLVGNKADLDEIDFIEAMGEEDEVSVILLYLESIEKGRRFIDVASRVVEEKPIIIQMEQVPKSVLRQYSDLYDEKIALILQIEQLEESRRRKKVPVREYVQRRRRFESQLSDIFKQINETSQDIKNISGRFADIVNRLEILEAERDGARAAAARLRRRYRNRRITREVYDRLRVEEERKVNRTTSRIDGLIFELRQAAEE